MKKYAKLTTKLTLFGVVLSVALASPCFAQKKNGQQKRKIDPRERPDYQLPPSSQPVGESGVIWYATWDTALAEAKRTGKPIFFMSAAATCSGISGIF